MSIQSQPFIDIRTGNIVTQVPLTQIQFFRKYNGAKLVDIVTGRKLDLLELYCQCFDYKCIQAHREAQGIDRGELEDLLGEIS